MSDDLRQDSLGRVAERVEAICDRTERIERLCERTDDRLRKLEERAAREDGQNYDARLTALSKRLKDLERRPGSKSLARSDYLKVGGVGAGISTGIVGIIEWILSMLRSSGKG